MTHINCQSPVSVFHIMIPFLQITEQSYFKQTPLEVFVLTVQ